jgi:mannose-6-phosphate isomerase-like protein (cupin superfamily)
MNVTEYIASGVLEDYCLGLLNEQDTLKVDQAISQFPEVKSAVDANMEALEAYAHSYVKQPPENLKAKILSIIDNLKKEEEATQSDLPLINRFSSSEKWLRIVKPLLPASPEQDIYTQPLRADGGVFQSILWLKSYYPDEVHGNVQESALVLEGECTCFIGDEIVHLAPGDFVQIPLHAHHNIKVTKGPVLAIIQRLKAV